MKKFLSGAAALVIAASVAGLALAQTTSLPTVAAGSVSQSNDRMSIVPNGIPTAQGQFASPAQILGTSKYTKTATTTSTLTYTQTFANDQTDLIIVPTPSGTMTYDYVTFAPNPSDGAKACIFSPVTITTLYLAANTGQSLNGAVTTLAANSRGCYLYSASNATWDRTQ